MKKKLLCGILAALMLLSAASCTGGNNGADTTSPDTTVGTTDAPANEDTAAPTETPTEETTEAPTEETTEDETEPPIEITAPAYEDIGLTDKLAGKDERIQLDFPFAQMTDSLSALKTNSRLAFTRSASPPRRSLISA